MAATEEQIRRRLDPSHWEQRYIDGSLPWDTLTPDPHLKAVVERYRIAPGRAIDVGCGTGTNVRWLAAQGFDVLGVDVSATAIEMAKARTPPDTAGVAFAVANILDEAQPGGFAFAYDRGCFHVFDGPHRARFAGRVADMLEPGGIWHSLIGSTDGPDRDTGPPRISALEVTSAVEPHFEILELRSEIFDNADDGNARAWILVARKR